MLQVPLSRLMLQQPRHPMAPIPPGALQPLFGRPPQVMPLGMMPQMGHPLTPRGMGQLPLTPRQGFQGGIPPFGFAAPAPMASPRPGSSHPWAIPHLSRQQVWPLPLPLLSSYFHLAFSLSPLHLSSVVAHSTLQHWGAPRWPADMLAA